MSPISRSGARARSRCWRLPLTRARSRWSSPEGKRKTCARLSRKKNAPGAVRSRKHPRPSTVRPSRLRSRPLRERRRRSHNRSRSRATVRGGTRKEAKVEGAEVAGGAGRKVRRSMSPDRRTRCSPVPGHRRRGRRRCRKSLGFDRRSRRGDEAKRQRVRRSLQAGTRVSNRSGRAVEMRPAVNRNRSARVNAAARDGSKSLIRVAVGEAGNKVRQTGVVTLRGNRMARRSPPGASPNPARKRSGFPETLPRPFRLQSTGRRKPADGRNAQEEEGEEAAARSLGLKGPGRPET